MRPILRLPAFRFALAALVCALCVSLLFLFPEHSIRSVWKGYRVLTVSLEEKESDVLKLLSSAGIDEIVTESNSAIENDSEMVPVQPFLGDKNRSLSSWFTNNERNSRYFYLAENPFIQAKTEKAFSGAPFSWSLERDEGIKPLPILVIALFLAAALVFSGDRIMLLSSGIPFILLCWSCNRHSVFVFCLFALAEAYILCGLMEPGKRRVNTRQKLVRLKKNPVILVPAGIALATLVFSGVHAIILTGISLVFEAALVYLVYCAQLTAETYVDKKRLHSRFSPELMHPDSVLKSALNPKNAAFVIAASIVAASGLFLFSGRKNAEGSQTVYIPAPAGYTAHIGFGLDDYSELCSLRSDPEYPDLAWFLSVRWNLDTAQWRRVHDPAVDPAAGNTVLQTHYEADASGAISLKTETMDTFDASYIRKTLSGTLTPLERMLIAQGRFLTVALERIRE